MSKFCSECGTELNGAKFCPNCGKGNGDIRKSVTIKQIEGLNIKPKYLLLMLFQLAYIVLLLCKWFDVNIPAVTEYSLFSEYNTFHTYNAHVYNIYDGIYKLANLLRDTGHDGVASYSSIFAVAVICFSIYIIYVCIKGIHHCLKCKTDAESKLFNSSVQLIALSLFVMISVGIINSSIEIPASAPVDKLINISGLPIIMLIFGIIGIITANRIYGIEESDNQDKQNESQYLTENEAYSNLFYQYEQRSDEELQYIIENTPDNISRQTAIDVMDLRKELDNK